MKNAAFLIIAIGLFFVFPQPATAKLVKGADGVWRDISSPESSSQVQPQLSSPSIQTNNIPSHIVETIRTIYKQKYPDDYSMQKTLIDDQLECYLFMQRYTRDPQIPTSILNKEKQIYAGKYPYDFSMQKVLVQDQVESYHFLQELNSVAGVPVSQLRRFKQIYKNKYPYDFSMQKVLVEDQIESYLALKK